MKTQSILRQLERNRGYFPEAAVREALEHKSEFVPHLLDILRHTVAAPNKVIQDEHHAAHLFAMYLLAQFREPRAYPLLIRLARLPDQMPFDLVGDAITEDFASILASVCGTELAPIKAIVEDPDVDEFVRTAALEALTIVFLEGRIPRDELVAYHRYLLEGGLEREPSYLWCALEGAIVAIHPAENMAELKKAFDEELLVPILFEWDEVEQIAQKSTAEVLAETHETHPRLIDDVVSCLEDWAYFEQPPSSGKDQPKAKPVAAPTQMAEAPEGYKIGPNDPCPCGSGKKYKKCCWLASLGGGSSGG